MRKTVSETGGLRDQRSEKGSGARKVERKGQQTGGMEKINKVAVQRSDNPYKRETRERTKSRNC